MTTTPEPLTWTPGDGPGALLAIRDRVKAAQDAGLEMERMTVTMEGESWRSTYEAPPRIDAEGDLCCVETVTVHGSPYYAVSRVEWTSADPDPAWADADVIAEVTDAGEVIGVLRSCTHPDGEWWATGQEPPVRTSGVQAEEVLSGHTVRPLIRDGRVCAEAILALGVDDHDAIYDAWIHNTGGFDVWEWLGGLGGSQ